MSDFWPDFFSAGWTCWIKWAGKDVCGYKRVGGPVPGILGSATTTSTDPVKCECIATAHCVHPSIPLSPTVAGSLLLLTFLPLNRPHVLCVCRHMILAAYPGCRAAAGDGRGLMMRAPRARLDKMCRALEMIMAVGREGGSLSLSSLGRPLLVNSAIPDSVVREALQKKPIVPALSLELSSRSLK